MGKPVHFAPEITTLGLCDPNNITNDITCK